MERPAQTTAKRAEANLVLFPGGLGDFLCCWPALAALRDATGAPLTLAARDAWFDVLPPDAVTALSIDRRAVADLFGSAPLAPATVELFRGFTRIESWTGHGDENFARRLTAASGTTRMAVHPFRDFRPGEHAAHYYARCLDVALRVRRLPIRPAAAEWADALWDRHRLGERVLVIHPGSGGGRKNWQGMADVASAWRAEGGAVISLAGPAEDEDAAGTACDLAMHNQTLDRVAAVLARASHYLGNDSGISHLAGLVGARGVALFGPTDPRAWRPLGGGVRVLSRPEPCGQCGIDVFCMHRLPIADVLATLRSIGEPV